VVLPDLGVGRLLAVPLGVGLEGGHDRAVDQRSRRVVDWINRTARRAGG